MYPQAISDPVGELLRRLNSIPEMRFTYLGGGTALALQLGHRRSDDLYFFAPEQFDYVSLKNGVLSRGLETIVVNQTSNHMELLIRSIKVDIIREQVPLKFSLRTIDPAFENIRIADPRDIGRMKLLSIGSRGSRKDFVDLYCLTREIIPLHELIAIAMEEGRGIRYSKLLFLKGLVDFEEADREGDLAIMWEIHWVEVKKTLIQEVKKIAEKITMKQ